MPETSFRLVNRITGASCYGEKVAEHSDPGAVFASILFFASVQGSFGGSCFNFSRWNPTLGFGVLARIFGNFPSWRVAVVFAQGIPPLAKSAKRYPSVSRIFGTGATDSQAEPSS